MVAESAQDLHFWRHVAAVGGGGDEAWFPRLDPEFGSERVHGILCLFQAQIRARPQQFDRIDRLAVTEQRFDATEIGKAKVVTITELEPREKNALGAQADQLGVHLGLRAGTEGLIDQEVFESIYNPGKLLLLAGWRDGEAAKAWTPTKPDAAASLRHRRVRVIRDYGMSDRREAPQFYPDVKRRADAMPAAGRRAVA